MRELTTEGVICLDDEGLDYSVARISYVCREDESFRYEIRPNYRVTDILDPEVFQGIPGVDLDLRLECYVRESRVPVFIEERTPAPNRQDFWELLGEQGMTAPNRLEWLMRSGAHYSGDRLFARFPDARDRLRSCELDSKELGALRPGVAVRQALAPFQLGCDLMVDGAAVPEAARRPMHSALRALFRSIVSQQRANHRAGVRAAQSAGLYRGRRRIETDPLLLRELVQEVRRGETTAADAAKRLGVSVATFYRRMREVS